MQSGSPAGPDSPFLDTITIADWLRDSSITEASRKNRARMIHSLEKANGATVEKIVEAVKAGEASPYAASRKFVDAIRPTLAPMTVRGQRSMLPVFWESVLGEARFSRRTFDRLVPMGASWASRPKLSPNRDRFVLMLKASKPNPRALISMLGCGGMRIAEALSRKWSDLEVRPEGHARVALMAWETKARYLRYSFLTKECVDWLRIASPNETGFLFPGDDDGHLYYASVQYQVKEAFRKAGLIDSPTGFYTVHSLRTFADAQLRECGLDSKYVSAIIGHRNRLQSEAHYLSWEAIEKSWVEKCAAKMCFLDNTTSLVAEKASVERRNGKLEALLERLLERMAQEGSPQS